MRVIKQMKGRTVLTQEQKDALLRILLSDLQDESEKIRNQTLFGIKEYSREDAFLLGKQSAIQEILPILEKVTGGKRKEQTVHSNRVVIYTKQTFPDGRKEFVIQ